MGIIQLQLKKSRKAQRHSQNFLMNGRNQLNQLHKISSGGIKIVSRG